MYNGFGVGCGGETVAKRNQLVAQFCKVVYFAVKNNLNTAVLIAYRLVACAEIDN